MRLWVVAFLVMVSGCGGPGVDEGASQPSHAPSNLQALAVEQAWGAMQMQGLAPPASSRLHMERVIAEFDHALGSPSGVNFASRADFERAVTGQRLAEIEGVVNDLSPQAPETARWRVYGAWITAVGRSFDDSVAFYPPTAKDDVDLLVAGTEEGVGIHFDGDSATPTIKSVSPGSPASLQGLPAGGKLISVKEKGMPEIAVSSASPADVREMLRGSRGSLVTVKVSSGGVVRDYALPRSTWAAQKDRAKASKIGGQWVVAIPRFYGDGLQSQYSTISDFKEAMQLVGDAPYILDLRGNPGGTMEQAEGLATLAGGSGHLWTIKGKRAKVAFNAAATAGRLPEAVWVDAGTGSAAEILAGALQVDGAKVVGRHTAGRGTMQLMVPLDNASFLRHGQSETGSLLLTTAVVEWDPKGTRKVSPDCVIDGEFANPSNKLYSNTTKACAPLHE